MKRTILLLLVVLLVSCRKEDPYEPIAEKTRTVLIYMVADNDLYNHAETDIEEMLQADFDEQTTDVFVYVDGIAGSTHHTPSLYQIEKGTLIVKKTYDKQNSTEKRVLRAVLNDLKEFSRTPHYGLALWSHGTGWLPPNLYTQLTMQSRLPGNLVGVSTKAFGRQARQEMDIRDLKEAIPYQLEFILFDACLMGGIEVIYELRNLTEYIIASPTDILTYGFTYNTLLKELGKETLDYQEIGKTYMDFYQAKSGMLQSATISVVKTEGLENMSSHFRHMLRTANVNFEDGRTVVGAQRYDMLLNSVFFDFEDYYLRLLPSAFHQDIQQHLEELVVYKSYTETFLGLDIKHFSGISTYIPHTRESRIDDYYKTLDWHQDVFTDY